MDDGCTVASTWGAKGAGTNFPRSRVTRNDAPRSAWAAVAPRHTTTRGFTSAISRSSQGLHAAISRPLGFLWMRHLPRCSQLKCFTTFVTYASARSIQELARGPDERPAGEVLVVSRLLTDEHEGRERFSLAEDRLGRALPEVTGPALLRCLAECWQGGSRAGRRAHA